MKKLILFLVFFCVAGAFAQEVDTTYAISANGDTIGVIHPKGTLPLLPEGMNLLNVQLPSVSQDSIDYYQNLASRYKKSGARKTSVGKGLMIGGGIATGLGLMMSVGSIADNSLSDDGEMFLLGYLSVCAGVCVFTPGLVLYIVGKSKLRKAERFEEKLDMLQNNQTYSLRFVPMVNPVNRSLGGNLALAF